MNDPIIKINNFSFHIYSKIIINDFSLNINLKEITVLMGPSGSGKSSILKSINRMNDFVDGFKYTGSIKIHEMDILNDYIDLSDLRRKVGMVFQKSNLFPLSIFENVIFGSKIAGIKNKVELAHIAETSLQKVYLWDEVKDRLNKSAFNLSGGQQQRLCIARMLATNPEIILMDEPTSALDTVSTAKIEELMLELKKEYTLVVVTHNLEQAERIGDSKVVLK